MSLVRFEMTNESGTGKQMAVNLTERVLVACSLGLAWV